MSGDPEIRDQDRGLEPVCGVRQVDIEAQRPGLIGVGGSVVEELFDALDDDAGGDVAVAVPTHSIGDDKQLQGGIRQQRVLVV